MMSCGISLKSALFNMTSEELIARFIDSVYGRVDDATIDTYLTEYVEYMKSLGEDIWAEFECALDVVQDFARYCEFGALASL